LGFINKKIKIKNRNEDHRTRLDTTNRQGFIKTLLKKETLMHFLISAQDEGMWDYFTLNLANKEHLEKWMAAAFADKAAGNKEAIYDRR
jgi:hypothetical protein